MSQPEINEGGAIMSQRGVSASEDISINGPTPISPSGGNIGSGRTRYWMWTDTIQQVQGRAGERQIKKEAGIGVCGGPMVWTNMFAVFSKNPD